MSFVQGIQDSTEKLFPKLVSLMNEEAGTEKYKFDVSPRYGQTQFKEQYGVIYEYVCRKETIAFSPSLVKIYFTAEVNMPSLFDRPPYCVGVEVLKVRKHFIYVLNVKGNLKFAVAVNHIKPKNVFAEMEALYDAAPICACAGNTNVRHNLHFSNISKESLNTWRLECRLQKIKARSGKQT